MDFQYSCWIDGASRGNPGSAAIGVFIRNNRTQGKTKISEYLGSELTNNYAEYSALLRCLAELKKLNAESFEIFADSLLVVQQINGLYSVRSKNVIPLYNSAKKTLSEFNNFKISHIPRAKNSMADKLANYALDKNK